MIEIYSVKNKKGKIKYITLAEVLRDKKRASEGCPGYSHGIFTGCKREACGFFCGGEEVIENTIRDFLDCYWWRTFGKINQVRLTLKFKEYPCVICGEFDCAHLTGR